MIFRASHNEVLDHRSHNEVLDHRSHKEVLDHRSHKEVLDHRSHKEVLDHRSVHANPLKPNFTPPNTKFFGPIPRQYRSLKF